MLFLLGSLRGTPAKFYGNEAAIADRKSEGFERGQAAPGRCLGEASRRNRGPRYPYASQSSPCHRRSTARLAKPGHGRQCPDETVKSRIQLPAERNNLTYECGQWQIHLGRRELLSNGAVVPIGARAFEIIELLVRSANELVTKNDIMNRIWPGAMVGENTLQVHISAIRKALGPDRAMLKTASGRGYRLLGSWTVRQQARRPRRSRPPRCARAEAVPATNFPLAAGRLIGRDAAARDVRDLVSAYRVVTLTGPGGIGKTSLAIEAARGLVADFERRRMVCRTGLAAQSRPRAVRGGQRDSG